MAQVYTVSAFSPSLNQTIRQIDLTNVLDVTSTQAQAQMVAEQFANLQNRQFHMQVCDWQARVQLEEVGVHTMPGFQKLG
jgi:sugar phosphate isomerase/epimerase